MSGFTTGSTFSSGPAPNTDGPHKSDMMNKADPRVDSDRDYSKNMGMNPHGTADTNRDAIDSVRDTSYSTGTTSTGGRGLTGAHSGTTVGPNSGPVYSGSNTGNARGTEGLSGARGSNISGVSGGHGSSGLPEGSVGPHSSRIANVADPRVDSDLDNNRSTGYSRGTGVSGTTGTSGTTGGLSGTHRTTGSSGISEGTAGPHSSRVANAADPRVDSDRDHRGAVGSSQTRHTGTTGTTGSHTTTTGTTGSHSTTTGSAATSNLSGHSPNTSGPAPNTAGPHKSDLLNKLDPRVDSNLDGSKTVGGNKTFEGANTNTKTSY